MKRVLCWILIFCLAVMAGCEAVPVETEPETSGIVTQPTTEPVTEPTTEPAEYIGLSVDQFPEVTVGESVTVSGTCDPEYPVYVNGQEARQDGLGNFSFEYPLEPGANEILLTHKEERVTAAVKRQYCVQYFTPEDSRQYGANATVFLRLAARQGSQITATFYGQEVEMKQSVDQLGMGLAEDFVLYLGYYFLPQYPQEDISMGRVEYTVTCDGITETYSSGEIVCSARGELLWSDPDATPEGYTDVGSGYIAEVVDVSVETFDGTTRNDYSHPNYNYLPAGTLDYCREGTIVTGDDCYYKLLRCGLRVSQRIKNTPYTYKTTVVDCYAGYLPDYNEINIASLRSEGHHTYLTVDCMWKAPFLFDFEEQEYVNAFFRDHTVENFDAGYIDITFCYATKVSGDIAIPQDNPLFSHAEWIENTSDHTLRLYLKREGGLYGWDAYYNEQDQLVFKFLNPVSVVPADNPYGADLTGITVMLDVGHGGSDTGAAGTDSRGYYWIERDRNLYLAQLVRAELESIGATVVMNRHANDEITTQRERILYLKEVAPDYCLAIHHNALSSNPDRNGFEVFYFTTYTQPAALKIHERTLQTELYKVSRLGWHYYYVARQTACPIVLVECGFLTSPHDIEGIASEEIMAQKAQNMVQGIVDYFLEVSGEAQ